MFEWLFPLPPLFYVGTLFGILVSGFVDRFWPTRVVTCNEKAQTLAAEVEDDTEGWHATLTLGLDHFERLQGLLEDKLEELDEDIDHYKEHPEELGKDLPEGEELTLEDYETYRESFVAILKPVRVCVTVLTALEEATDE